MVYLDLYNGRHSPDEKLDDWGFQGPTFGPFESIQLTYGSHLKCHNGPLNKDWDFDVSEDGVFFEGGYYGDFNITSEVFLKDQLEVSGKVLSCEKKDLPLLLPLAKDREWVRLYMENHFKKGKK
jgi:hypothetical protein